MPRPCRSRCCVCASPSATRRSMRPRTGSRASRAGCEEIRRMRPLRVTLVQQPLVWGDPAANRERFGRLLAPLAGATDLIVLPETFTTGFSMEVERLGEAAGGPSTKWLAERARELDAAITGSLITRDSGRYYKRLLWAEPGGVSARHYDKRHLFRMAREHQHFAPGGAALSVLWQLPRGRNEI